MVYGESPGGGGPNSRAPAPKEVNAEDLVHIGGERKVSNVITTMRINHMFLWGLPCARHSLEEKKIKENKELAAQKKKNEYRINHVHIRRIRTLLQQYAREMCFCSFLTAKFQTLACSISVQILLPNFVSNWSLRGPAGGAPETAVDIYWVQCIINIKKLTLPWNI